MANFRIRRRMAFRYIPRAVEVPHVRAAGARGVLRVHAARAARRGRGARRHARAARGDAARDTPSGPRALL